MEKIHKQKEFKSLNNALLQDEVIHDYVVANIKNARFLVVATDKRVIFVQKKLMSESIEAINLDDIALSPFKSGFLGTSFGINHHVLKIQDKKKAQSFYNLLSPHSGQSNVATTQHKKKNNTVGFIAFIILLGGIVAALNSNDEESTPIKTNSKVNDVIIVDHTKYNEALANKDPIIIDIENAVNNDEITSATVLRDAQLNTDAKKADSKIAMIYLRWDRKNPTDQTRKMLSMQSARLANEIGKHKNVSEIVVFWEVPYHLENQNIAKFNYSKKNDKWIVNSEWFAPVIR
ncbi:PH domain-containing protein [Wohlfahrtiimonas chitiniclastica]|uniref:PH domain-containing protein n=1 Tax=Wohlfahrtiimonas chitiniclastica TaxID=400946 RepID=UPI000B98A7E9|nr:PH domain-containing protein [Wohlfahrtiimonas chitiniclastica]OYQ76097.1 hypothetical protein B9T18_01700 [Wohlfahrtiimonas chitiniclastica]